MTPFAQYRREMEKLVLKMAWPEGANPEDEQLLTHEWLVTNGLGGYASSTVLGVCTCRYHGILIAALPAPLGRIEMLSHLIEEIRMPDGTMVQISGHEYACDLLKYRGGGCLVEFRLDIGLPVWRYKVGRFVLEKRIFMPHMQNTVYVDYRIVSGRGTVTLFLRPEMHFRSHETPVSEPLAERYRMVSSEEHHEIHSEGRYPPLRISIHGGRWSFSKDEKGIRRQITCLSPRQQVEGSAADAPLIQRNPKHRAKRPV